MLHSWGSVPPILPAQVPVRDGSGSDRPELSNRCRLPIIPTDLFPRELADITGVAYSRIKISFDVICLAVTACLTGLILGHIKGLGIGTVVAAFTMGKAIGLVGRWLDKKFDFVSFMKK
jgi:uncharacterized membrane protein YczE